MKYLSCTDTAKLIRQALKEAFPGVKFSVKSSTYSGGASIRVRWIDGPSTPMVEAIAGTFSGAYFDGSTDYKGSTYALVDGLQTRFGADFVFCERENSDAAVARALAQLARYWGAEALEGATVEAFRKGDLYRMAHLGSGCDAVQSMVHRAMSKHSFYLAPRKSKTANKVIYLGNDGYSDRAALHVE